MLRNGPILGIVRSSQSAGHGEKGSIVVNCAKGVSMGCVPGVSGGDLKMLRQQDAFHRDFGISESAGRRGVRETVICF